MLENGATGEDPRWELVERVAASKGFINAPVLRSFLLYVCKQVFDGRGEEIKEQQIGSQVFGRPAGYNPAEDNIVRVRAREVRRRLEIYFKIEGIGEETIISMPKGHYVPVFDPRPDDAAARAIAPDQNPLRVARRLWPGWSAWWITGILAMLCLWQWIRAPSPGVRTNEVWNGSPSAYRLLWTQLCNPPQQTLIIVADSGFSFFQDNTIA